MLKLGVEEVRRLIDELKNKDKPKIKSPRPFDPRFAA